MKTRNFGKIHEVLEVPDLVEIHKTSYEQFLQKALPRGKARKNQGLELIFRETFPVVDLNERGVLEYVSYSLEEPRYSSFQCLERGVSYCVSLWVKMRLLIKKPAREVKEEKIFLTYIPMMTAEGSFIINGVERIVVNQLHRSPGILYDLEIYPNGERKYSAKVIPQWGAWLEFELEPNDTLYISIDRRRRLPVTTLLKAWGYDEEKMLETFCKREESFLSGNNFAQLAGRTIAETILEKDGKILAQSPQVIDEALLKRIKELKLKKIKVFGQKSSIVIPLTLNRDLAQSQEEALIEICRRLKPYDPPTVEGGKALFHSLFSDPRRYNLGEIGRYRLNKRLQMDVPLETKTLRREDLIKIINGLIKIKRDKARGDDIDHLGNRRLATVGELFTNSLRAAFLKMARMIRERMSVVDLGTTTLRALINIRPVNEAINAFFGTSQLSQFMDQTNPLAELTHKRRVSALGPGGLSRERAGFEVRDVHFSHYGRICPIETPEGQNIGLIASLASYARVNNLGLIETPYRRVKKGKVTNDIDYLSADVEDEFIIAQANVPLAPDGRFKDKEVQGRYRDDFLVAPANDIEYMDISPKQLVGLSASLIPFLEHDDANRALMGSNMQRQAVPLIFPEPPLVQTGMERIAAANSHRMLLARHRGKVEMVDAEKIIIGKEVYHLSKFRRSNQSTCINQRPVVRKGETVRRGQILSDGPALSQGELSLGRNVLVAFMPWEGYNFEDAILINERLVKEDLFSSVHIEEFKVEVRDTKLGEEEISRDIPSLGEESLKNLDEDGIVRLGTWVNPGDILVGKVTPRETIKLSAEERLLRAIFGEKAKGVRDTSLRVPPGYGGKVIRAEYFSRKEGDELPLGVSKLIKVYVAQLRKVSEGDKMAGRHGNKGVVSKILPEESMPYLEDGTAVDVVLNPLGVPSRMNIGQILETHLGLAAKKLGVKMINPVFDAATEEEIGQVLKEAGYREEKMTLYDGRSGQAFDQKVTVGYIYMMKLSHLVEDKIHARSIGPYSLITQQPLGGRAQFGGQRFGEMEVWALEAYGAAYTLQEMLTVKSDDAQGRTKLYESIVKSQPPPRVGIPESFNVLVRELQGLGLNISFIDKRKKMIAPESLFSMAEENRFRLEDFLGIRIGIASPEMIRNWSHGEVKKPETINYRTFKPEREGLFCEKIFGPTQDWKCFCEKYEGIRYKGITCDRCGVELVESSVRRARMGHIELVTPVSHIWYVKEIPSPLALLLDISQRELEKVLYFESYIVIDPGKTSLKKKELIAEKEYRHFSSEGNSSLIAKMGAEAILELLKEINLKQVLKECEEVVKKKASSPKKKKMSKKLELVQLFLKSGNRPEWMIMKAIPIIPPDLRPMVQLESGRFATSDINDLYRRVINRNNRLKRLLEINAPQIIIQNEKRMLQEAVDTLFHNGRRGSPVIMGNRPLRSLTDLLCGKQGRFRQNLLGKRVDYSGRSVIVVGPHLKLSQCGLPKRMALELFKPFILERLAGREILPNIKNAKKRIEEGSSEVWNILEEVTKNYYVLLNRAPTLHRLGIQSFQPVLVEGSAIQLHPLVCAGFNADFDGDQMAVHVPLSIESRLEAQMLTLSVNNLLSPANGRPIVSPTQDVVLGCYYLTREADGKLGEGKYFVDFNEVHTAYNLGYVDLHAKIRLCTKANGKEKIIGTTVGRAIFNSIFSPLIKDFPYINKTLRKKDMGKLISDIYTMAGATKTAELLDKIKEMGFHYITRAGLSIGINDVRIPPSKEKIIEHARKEARDAEARYREGLISEGEKYNQTIDIWSRTTNTLSSAMLENLSQDQNGFNPLYLIFDSGARGSELQVRQLTAMRGLMTKPSGEIIDLPITANLREGLSVLEYFISTHGGRKGLADTALKTASAGYLTRRLVDISQDVSVLEEDCGTANGINVSALKEGGEVIESLRERILGRVALGDTTNPLSGEILVKDSEEITEEKVELIENAGIERVRIRTVLTCEAERGVCQKCYGRDLARMKMVSLGEAVGIIAAQSIGEPGTQLTLRTFHIGGTAFTQAEEKEVRFKFPVEVIEVPRNLILREKDKTLITNRRGEIIVRRILGEYPLPANAKINVFDGLWVTTGEQLYQSEKKIIKAEVTGVVKIDKENGKIYITGDESSLPIQAGTVIKVNAGQIVGESLPLAEFDPFSEPILSESDGKVAFRDIVKGETMKEDIDENTGLLERTIIEHKEGRFHPCIQVKGKEGEHTYPLPMGALLLAKNGQEVHSGDALAKIPRQIVKTRDITGGLPRVEELFEARKPRDKTVISEVDGKVEIRSGGRGTRKIIAQGERGTKEYVVPEGKHLWVRDGDRIKVGEPLTSGSIDPHDLLKIKGERALQEYLVNEIQAVYRLQGVEINDKHIEIIVRQMLRRVEIEDPGDTKFLVGEQVDKFRFSKENKRLAKKGDKPAKARPLLCGITKASLMSDSFISAASFQETTHVLTQAAISGRNDELLGIKENVIIGRLIPVGTGLSNYCSIEVKKQNVDN